LVAIPLFDSTRDHFNASSYKGENITITIVTMPEGISEVPAKAHLVTRGKMNTRKTIGFLQKLTMDFHFDDALKFTQGSCKDSPFEGQVPAKAHLVFRGSCKSSP
jgi:hypothetical protein